MESKEKPKRLRRESLKLQVRSETFLRKLDHAEELKREFFLFMENRKNNPKTENKKG